MQAELGDLQLICGVQADRAEFTGVKRWSYSADYDVTTLRRYEQAKLVNTTQSLLDTLNYWWTFGYMHVHLEQNGEQLQARVRPGDERNKTFCSNPICQSRIQFRQQFKIFFL